MRMLGTEPWSFRRATCAHVLLAADPSLLSPTPHFSSAVMTQCLAEFSMQALNSQSSPSKPRSCGCHVSASQEAEPRGVSHCTCLPLSCAALFLCIRAARPPTFLPSTDWAALLISHADPTFPSPRRYHATTQCCSMCFVKGGIVLPLSHVRLVFAPWTIC